MGVVHQRPAISVINIPTLRTLHLLYIHYLLVLRDKSLFGSTRGGKALTISYSMAHILTTLSFRLSRLSGLNYFLVYPSPVRTLNAVVKRKSYW